MYIWIGILVAWFVVLLCMARYGDKLALKACKSQQRKTMVDYCNSMEQYMHPNTHVTDEAALVDALKNENIVYRGCTR